jgi:hypothetical protein
MYHYLSLPIEFESLRRVKTDYLGKDCLFIFYDDIVDFNLFAPDWYSYQTKDRYWHLVKMAPKHKEFTINLKVLYVEVPKYKNDHKDEFMISLKMPDGKWFWIAHFKDKIVLQSVNMGLIKREFTKLEEAFDFLRSIYGEKHD